MQDVIIIGGGQAGLAMAYALTQRGIATQILDAGSAIGQAWRDRYDSLVLFTPTQYSALPGLPFPKPYDTYPTRDDVVTYLERYVSTFQLPLQLGTHVTSLQAHTPGFRIETNREAYTARAVIVATGPFQRPFTPAFAAALDRSVVQLHSAGYRNPAQLLPGRTLIVGAGNSGAQIAAELAATHDVTLALSRRPPALPQRFLGRDIFWWLHTVGIMRVSADSWLGKRLRRADPLIGSDLRTLARQQGVQIAPRVVGAAGTAVTFADGRSQTFANVIWATGYRPAYSWLNLPALDPQGWPVQHQGASPIPGLYFIGLSWMHRRSSALLGGVGADAFALADAVAGFLGTRAKTNLD